MNNSSLLSCIWDVCPLLVVWEIWKECNRQIFQDKQESVERLSLLINHLIEEFSSVDVSQRLIPSVVMSKFDEKIQRAWPGIKLRSVNGLSRVDLIHDNMLKEEWCIPKEGWVKINFNRASQGNLG